MRRPDVPSERFEAKGSAGQAFGDTLCDSGEACPTRYSNRQPVAGPTHTAGWYGHWYMKMDCWQSEQAHYVKITPSGQVELMKWPQQEPDHTELWPEAG